MSSNFATACRAYDPSIVIIGAGFAGVAMAHRLKKDGFTNFTILEKAAGLLHDQVTVSVTRPDWPVWS